MVEWTLNPTNSPRMWQALEDGCVWVEEMRHISVATGWRPLIEECHTELTKLCNGDGYELVRIKQKFGGLRYWAHPPENVADHTKQRFYEVINDVEQRSWTICEACTATGTRRHREKFSSPGRGYSIVLCDACDVFYPDPPWGPPKGDIIGDMKKAGYSLLQISDHLDGYKIGPPENAHPLEDS